MLFARTIWCNAVLLCIDRAHSHVSKFGKVAKWSLEAAIELDDKIAIIWFTAVPYPTQSTTFPAPRLLLYSTRTSGSQLISDSSTRPLNFPNALFRAVAVMNIR
jgi:hypothetical protein